MYEYLRIKEGQMFRYGAQFTFLFSLWVSVTSEFSDTNTMVNMIILSLRFIHHSSGTIGEMEAVWKTPILG